MGKKDAKKPFSDHQDKRKTTNGHHSGKSEKVSKESKPKDSQRSKEERNVSSSTGTRPRPVAVKVPRQPDRYEEPSHDITTQVDVDRNRGVDFSRYLDTNISGNSSFKLEEEKTWDKDTLDLHGVYFNLDLQNLAVEIKKLPLLERLRVDQDLFTEKQLEHSDVSLDSCGRNCQPDKNPATTAEFVVSMLKEDRPKDEPRDVTTALEDELDSLLTLNVVNFPEMDTSAHVAEVSSVARGVPGGQPTMTLTRDVASAFTVSSNDWLDDLLND